MNLIFYFANEFVRLQAIRSDPQPPVGQPAYGPGPGVYAQGSIGPQSGFQTVPQNIYVMNPGMQYQQQSRWSRIVSVIRAGH